jgi:putative membrane protein (TIGR04086 family)
MRRRPGLEPQAIVPGATVAVAVIAVAVATSRAVDATHLNERSYLILPLVEVALVGLFAGGWSAARRCRRAPLVHGAAAAISAVVACCVPAVGIRLVRGDEVAWEAVVVWLLSALAAGTAGGLASLRPRHRADSPG